MKIFAWNPLQQSRVSATVTVLTIVGVLAVVDATGPVGLSAQSDQAGPDMTPTLLRRLAEAVDGHRTGRDVWVVAELAFPNRVVAVSDDRDSAVADSMSSEIRDVGIFGRFRAPRDILPSLGFPPGSPDTIPDIVFADGGCTHVVSSAMEENGSAMCPPEFFLADSVTSFELVYHLLDRTVTVPILKSTDAIFLTVSAVDKFVVPYYARILGVEEAFRMRQEMLRQIISSPVIVR